MAQSPGWYPAPDGNGQQWWNGAGWSETRRAATATTPPPVYFASNPAPQHPGEVGASRLIDLRQNRNAVTGLVLGIVATVFLGILAPVGIVFSMMGIAQARRLREQGASTTGMVVAIAGLGVSSFAAVVALVQFVLFVTAVFGVDFSVTSDVPGLGLFGFMAGF